MIYLACPYSGTPRQQRERLRQARRATKYLASRGYHLYSPLVYSAALLDLDAPDTLAYWMAIDLPIVRACSAVWIMTLPGWQESVGVTAEIAEARANGIPVYTWAGYGAEPELLAA